MFRTALLKPVTLNTVVLFVVLLVAGIASLSVSSANSDSAGPQMNSVRMISLATNDVVYNPADDKLYASIPSNAGITGNSIRRIDPRTGEVAAPIWVGSEPTKLAMANDGESLYISLYGASSIRRFNTATQTPGPQFSLGYNSTGRFNMQDLAVSPDNPNLVAVARHYDGSIFNGAGVAVFDNNAQLPQAVTSSGIQSLAFSASGSSLYGSGQSGLQTMGITAGGVTVTNTSQVISQSQIKFGGGRIFSADGHVIDAASKTLLGCFPQIYSMAFVPDTTAGRCFFAVSDPQNPSTIIIKAFNINTFTQIGSVAIPNAPGNPANMVRWGANGLAFRTTAGRLFVVQRALIPSQEPIPTPTVTPAPTVTPTATPFETRMYALPLRTKNLIHHTASGKIYASVPSTNGASGNSIAKIDPMTGIVEQTVWVGSEPNKLALANDGNTLFVGLDGAKEVRKFDIAQGTAGIQFQGGIVDSYGPLDVVDMAVSPEDPNTVTNAELETTTTIYNRRLQPIEVKDALNQIYRFGYDALGRVTSQTRAGGTMSFAYDDALNQTKRTDYAGRVTDYTYDKLNRLAKIEYDGGAGNQTPNLQSVYGYDEISRLTSATNESGTVAFTYDNRNRTKTTTDVFGHVIENEYELSPTVNQKRLKFDGAMHAVYNFDDAGRLTNLLNSSDSSAISFGYDIEDKITSRLYPNGVTTSYEYDDMDRLKRLKDISPTATLFDRQYTYNNASQINQITEPDNTRTFGHDLVDRLRTVTASNNQNENYLFDDVGNRTSSHKSSTYGYQPLNKLASTQTGTYAHDANGNTIQKSEGKDFWRYTWDYENRMTAASTRKQTVRYKYDALGRRVQRFIPGGKENTKFIHDGQDVLADDNAGTLTNYQNGPGIDKKLRVQTGSTANYFLSDHLSSTNGLVDSSGALTSQTSYDSFGNPTSNLSTRYGFTGRETDNFTGLMYYRARFYDPNLGRFISEDPIGLGGGINQFAYVSNNPVGKTDPLGLYEKDVHYYLTQYLAIRTGCFSSGQAVAIANGNQMTDDNENTAPGFNRRYQNSTYHALNDEAAPGVGSPHLAAMATAPQIDFMAFGRQLHYLQDTFSHNGYPNSIIGHFFPGHLVDKTNSDPGKAMKMAESTWNAMTDFAKKAGCKCSPTMDASTRQAVNNFNNLPGSNFGRLNTIDSTGGFLDALITNPGGYLANKRRALGYY